ncbi:MAG: alpha-amylase family glycosyl hydrolase [Flavobacteriales bacterium]|nr:alpha-amylase family glycosyl hydrolase [Flavobacteriales bacterium]
MIIKFKNLGILIIFFTNTLYSSNFSNISSDKRSSNVVVEPPHWWVGLPDQNLEIILHGENIGLNEFELSKKAVGVSITKTTILPNPNYIILHITIEKSANAQILSFKSEGEAGKFNFEYELKSRNSKDRGLSGDDFIYLITPDRFGNGDASNDSFDHFNQTGVNREEPYDRHGGDIQGIIDHLDYIEELGVTAVWPNPLLENDQPHESYHGYAITDHFNIDQRFGSNELFHTLMDSLESRDMKMIMDVVYNHIGNEHHLFKDIPDSSWFHFHDGFFQTNYRAPALMDPYASDFDKDKMTDGWFDKHMPDVNQKNSHVAKYFIQQTLWWIEEFGIDALRIDTYAYPDQAFMRNWGKAVKDAFPEIFLFAETWVHGTSVQGWFLGDALGPEENYLDALTDFQVYYAFNDAMNQGQSWTGGIAKMYYTLAKDYVYDHPEKMVTFLDNHDLARFSGVVNRDFDKFKMGVGMLMTMRGIPSIYYGTEILMSETDGHGKIREDFPGGWPADSLNKFRAEGRSEMENEAFDYISDLAKLRSGSSALSAGNTTQYVPVDGLYVYFRWDEIETYMIVVNTSEKEVSSPIEKYDQFLGAQTIEGRKPILEDALTGESVSATEQIISSPKSLNIYRVIPFMP